MRSLDFVWPVQEVSSWALVKMVQICGQHAGKGWFERKDGGVEKQKTSHPLSFLAFQLV